LKNAGTSDYPGGAFVALLSKRTYFERATVKIYASVLSLEIPLPGIRQETSQAWKGRVGIGAQRGGYAFGEKNLYKLF